MEVRHTHVGCAGRLTPVCFLLRVSRGIFPFLGPAFASPSPHSESLLYVPELLLGTSYKPSTMDRHTRDDHSASLDILDQSFWDRRRPPIGSNGSAHLGNNLGPSYLDTSAHDQDHEHHELDPLAGLSSQKRDYSSSSSSSDHELDHRPKKQTSGNKKSQADKEKTGPRRATQACLRCRKQKLRCVGGYPCDRCVKSKNTCDFGRVSSASASAPGQRDSGGADVATARLEQLESSVANLLAGLAGGSGGHPPAFPNGADVLHQHFPAGHDPRDHSPFVDTPHAGPSWSTLSSSIPRPHADRLGSIHTRPSNTSIAEELARSHVRFSTSPSHILGPQHDLSPSTYSGSVFGSHSLENDDRKASIGFKRKGKSKGQEPEERLAAVTDQPYDPPFKALTYEVSLYQVQMNASLLTLSLARGLGQSRGLTDEHPRTRKLYIQ